MGAQKNFGKKKETAKVKRAKRREKKLRALKRAGIVPTKPFSLSSSCSSALGTTTMHVDDETTPRLGGMKMMMEEIVVPSVS